MSDIVEQQKPSSPPGDKVESEAATPSTTPSMDERITCATIEDYKDVLGEIAKVSDKVVRESYVNKLADSLKISKSTIQKAVLEAIKSAAPTTEDAKISGIKTALLPGLVDLVSVKDGKIRYLIMNSQEFKLARSWKDQDGNTCIPPDQGDIEFLVPSAYKVASHIRDLNDHRLYEDIRTFCKRFSYLDDGTWPIIILAIFLSYIQDHPDIRYIPGIYFYAVAERGKSRTAKTMLALSYRGIHLLDIRTANIIRFSQRLNATLFFDITDFWKTAEKGDGCDIMLGRFEKGTRVARVLYPDKGPFDDQKFFNVFGSTIIATNEPANPIFESRCLSITMPNMPGQYENLTPEMGLPLKERLTAWRARMMNKPLSHVEQISGISGRLWDISKPIFQLAQMIAPETVEVIESVIKSMADQKVENKRETLEGKIVAAIDGLVVRSSPEPWVIPVEKIRSGVNETIVNELYHYSSQKIGRRIQSLSIETKKNNGTSRVYISARELDALKEQYGLIDRSNSSETLQHSTTLPSTAMTAAEGGRESLESKRLEINSPE